ncbi:unnamed protein product, partial [Notodromas monacha]
MVVVADGKVLILDVQVTSDSHVTSLGSKFMDKVAYYDQPDLKEKVLAFVNDKIFQAVPLTGSSNVTVAGVIWSWRGAFSKDTHKILSVLGIKKCHIRLLTALLMELNCEILRKNCGRVPGASVTGAANLNSVETGFSCPTCSRSFPSRIGLSAHRRQSLLCKAAFHAETAVCANSRTRARWTDEEVNVLARIEMSLNQHGVKLTNARVLAEYAKMNANRSLDSIKGMRRSERYQERLSALIMENNSNEQQQEQDSELAQNDTTVAEWAEIQLTIPDLPTNLIELLRALQSCDTRKAMELVDKVMILWSKQLPANEVGEKSKVPPQPLSNRRRKVLERRQQYRRMQLMYKRSRTLAANQCLSGEWREGASGFPTEALKAYWCANFDAPVKGDERPAQIGRTNISLVEPFTADEVKRILADSTPTAPGLDGVKLADLRRVAEKLDEMLSNLKTAPLKPQQRLYILRHHLIPKLLHQLVLSPQTSGRLKIIDCKIRGAVRGWLTLPRDTPIGFFYASYQDGGLSISCLRNLIPCLQVSRFEKLKDVNEPDIQAVLNHTHMRSFICKAR